MPAPGVKEGEGGVTRGILRSEEEEGVEWGLVRGVIVLAGLGVERL